MRSPEQRVGPPHSPNQLFHVLVGARAAPGPRVEGRASEHRRRKCGRRADRRAGPRQGVDERFDQKTLPGTSRSGEEARLLLIDDDVEDPLLFSRKCWQVLKRPPFRLTVRVTEDVFPDRRDLLHESVGRLQRNHDALLTPQMTDDGARHVGKPLPPSSTLDRDVQL